MGAFPVTLIIAFQTFTGNKVNTTHWRHSRPAWVVDPHCTKLTTVVWWRSSF